MDTGAAARWLEVSPSTLEKWRVSGSGPAFIKFGRVVRYDPIDLDAFKNGHRQQSTSEPQPDRPGHLDGPERSPNSTQVGEGESEPSLARNTRSGARR
jgi:hypothetical protein